MTTPYKALLWVWMLILTGCDTPKTHPKVTLAPPNTPQRRAQPIHTIAESSAGHTTVEGLKITYAHLNGVIFSHRGDAHSGLKAMRLRLDNPTEQPITIDAQSLWLSTQRCQDTDWRRATQLKPNRWTSRPTGPIKNNRVIIGAQSTRHITWHHDLHEPRGGCGYGFVFASGSGQRYRLIVPVSFEREADAR